MSQRMTKPTKWHVRQAKTDQPGHPPSPIRVFAVRMKKAWVLSYPLRAQRRLWSDRAEAQADLSLRWAYMPFCRFCHALAHISGVLVKADQRLHCSSEDILDSWLPKECEDSGQTAWCTCNILGNMVPQIKFNGYLTIRLHENIQVYYTLKASYWIALTEKALLAESFCRPWSRETIQQKTNCFPGVWTDFQVDLFLKKRVRSQRVLLIPSFTRSYQIRFGQSNLPWRCIFLP